MRIALAATVVATLALAWGCASMPERFGRALELSAWWNEGADGSVNRVTPSGGLGTGASFAQEDSYGVGATLHVAALFPPQTQLVRIVGGPDEWTRDAIPVEVRETRSEPTPKPPPPKKKRKLPPGTEWGAASVTMAVGAAEWILRRHGGAGIVLPAAGWIARVARRCVARLGNKKVSS